MNLSIATADRATHLKIVATALLLATGIATSAIAINIAHGPGPSAAAQPPALTGVATGTPAMRTAAEGAAARTVLR